MTVKLDKNESIIYITVIESNDSELNDVILLP